VRIPSIGEPASAVPSPRTAPAIEHGYAAQPAVGVCSKSVLPTSAAEAGVAEAASASAASAAALLT
jgi:hypothetical protein